MLSKRQIVQNCDTQSAYLITMMKKIKFLFLLFKTKLTKGLVGLKVLKLLLHMIFSKYTQVPT